mmetsp:Transcript_6378/g.15650  ORF Transcript_6378/g.15650 Transcript_6378/m.15650 type:complete len:90 (+) Transcript_6378:1646-1915(+)
MVAGNLRLCYWGNVLMLRWVILVLIYAFMPFSVSKEAAFLFANALFLVHQSLSRPYLSSAANMVESLILVAFGALYLPYVVEMHILRRR